MAPIRETGNQRNQFRRFGRFCHLVSGDRKSGLQAALTFESSVSPGARIQLPLVRAAARRRARVRRSLSLVPVCFSRQAVLTVCSFRQSRERAQASTSELRKKDTDSFFTPSRRPGTA